MQLRPMLQSHLLAIYEPSREEPFQGRVKQKVQKTWLRSRSHLGLMASLRALLQRTGRTLQPTLSLAHLASLSNLFIFGSSAGSVLMLAGNDLQGLKIFGATPQTEKEGCAVCVVGDEPCRSLLNPCGSISGFELAVSATSPLPIWTKVRRRGIKRRVCVEI